jgi:DNA-binding response OmpR family regulator
VQTSDSVADLRGLLSATESEVCGQRSENIVFNGVFNMARILLVDDDRDIREMGCMLLSTAGHDVFSAAGAMEALTFLRDNPVDIVITDANMPLHSGFDLTRTIKRDPRYQSITVAMLTGRREKRDIEHALEIGVNDYIIKPLDPLLFLQKVTDLLERRPPQERVEVDFAALKINISASAKFTIEIASLSELGVVVRSPQLFREGTRIELETDLFARVGIDAPYCRVGTSLEREASTSKETYWETRIAFVGIDERARTKIRAWVHSNTVRSAKAA